MAEEKAFTVKMDSPVMVAIGFADHNDALKFAAACGSIMAMDPTDDDFKEVTRTLKDSSESFGVYVKDKELEKKLREEGKNSI